MGQRIIILLVVFMLILSGKIFAQQIKSETVISTLLIKELGFDFKKMFRGDDKTTDLTVFSKKLNYSSGITEKKYHSLLVNPVLQSSFYSNHLGFFCKKEILLEKVTTVPFRFRLGSLEYVNKIEGKKY